MLNKLKSYGHTTCNEQGFFEVRWEVNSFWRKLFGAKTTFKFVNHDLNKDNYKTSYLSEQQWFDEEGKIVSPCSHYEITLVLQSIIYSEGWL